MTQTPDVRDVLASQFDQYAVRRTLHHERPHITYEVTVDGRRAVCKVACAPTTDVGAEAAVSDHLDRTTSIPVPSVLAAEAGAFVATWTDDLPDRDAVPHPDDLSRARARALGAAMANLHEATADQFTRPGPVCFSPDESTPGCERGRYLSVDDHPDWTAVARELLKRHRAHLDRVGWARPAKRALALLDDCPALFDGAGSPVLCHGNIYPEHVGFAPDAGDAGRDVPGDSNDLTAGSGKPVDAADVAAMIDFEHALVAPAEYDFWRTGLPVFYTRDLEPRSQFSAFRTGYESVRSLPMGVDRRREAWWVVNLVTYCTSIAVEHEGIGPDERPQAEAMADLVDELCASIRDRRD